MSRDSVSSMLATLMAADPSVADAVLDIAPPVELRRSERYLESVAALVRPSLEHLAEAGTDRQREILAYARRMGVSC